VRSPLLHALGHPAASLPGKDHASLPVVGDRHEVRPILPHAWPIVDEDEVQLAIRPSRPGLGKRTSRDLLHSLAMPALVGRPGVLQRLVRRCNMRLIGGRLPPVTGPGTQQAQDERDEDHRTDSDQDYG
jgi:hypothetical protein